MGVVSMNLKILYIDDERVNLSNFELTFEDEFKVATFLGPKEALHWLEANQDVAIVIVDQRMGGGTGLQVLEKIAQKVPQTIRILVNSYVVTKEIEAAVESGLILRCIQKPWNADDFVFTIRQARENFLLMRQNEALRLELMQAKGALLVAQEGPGQRSCACDDSSDGHRQTTELQVNGVVRQEGAAQEKSVGGLLPICASCKKIRDKQGVWHHVEAYIERNSGVHCSHGICPDCVGLVYPEFSLTRHPEALVHTGKG